MTVVRDVQTSRGPARVHVDEPPAPTARLVLGHGAGGGVQAPDLAALADALPRRGVAVWRVEQPWRVAGRRVAPAPATLDEVWTQLLPHVPADAPLVLGGRSAGARVACRTAHVAGARAVVALAFPLHPPGRPEKSRAHELDAVTVPLLVVQGERDPFGRPEEIPPGPLRTVVSVAGDHALRADLAAVVTHVGSFVLASTG
jgi:predicted alpha/beta-hydrolase family hydrolase